jgi:hypothetical protein
VPPRGSSSGAALAADARAAQLWLIPVALVAYVGSMPMRKGIAIALSYWLRGPVRV